MSRLWLLNLGAELELEGRELSAAARAKSHAEARALAQALVPAGDAWFTEGGPMAKGAEGRAFLPTPAAIARLRALGANIDAPSAEILREANSRAFATKHFPRAGVSIVRHIDELGEGGARLLKRDLSFAGGGQRRVGHRLTEADRRWVMGALARGALCVEPWCSLDDEVGVPGFIHRSGGIDVGVPVSQVVIGGRWRSSAAAPDGSRPSEGLRAACRDAGRRLQELGYFGAFNIDAHHSTEYGWTLISEINARYTMGWALGWPDGRPDVGRSS